MRGLRIAVVGATGAVGREMWRLIEESDLAVAEIHAFTSERSAGRVLSFRGSSVPCRELTEASVASIDLVLASAGGANSRVWSPRFAAAGAVVVDNSSAFRTDPACGLVIPEVNAAELERPVSIFAVPNCSTIQLVAALAPLHRAWGLRAVRVATYQSVSGAGARAIEELERGTRAALSGEEERPEVFSHPIAFNLVPQIGAFDETGETQEERKMRDETRRILALPDLPVSATCVRVPVVRGHSEAVWASFAAVPDPADARDLLRAAGIVVEDDPERGLYPLPRRAAGRPEVFVGRIRPDTADPRGLCLWVVADNLLKGAAGNAFDIARALIARGRVGAAEASA